jgi:hypothetical protein
VQYGRKQTLKQKPNHACFLHNCDDIFRSG